MLNLTFILLKLSNEFDLSKLSFDWIREFCFIFCVFRAYTTRATNNNFDPQSPFRRGYLAALLKEALPMDNSRNELALSY